MLMHASKHSKRCETPSSVLLPSHLFLSPLPPITFCIHVYPLYLSIISLLPTYLSCSPLFLSLIPFTISSLHLCLSPIFYHQHYLIVFILPSFYQARFFCLPNLSPPVFSLTQLNTLAISVGITAFRGELAPFTNDLASFLSA